MSTSPTDRTSSVDRDSLLAIGIVRKAHGVRGEASVEPWTEDPLRFESLEQVYLVSPRNTKILEARIRSIRHHGNRVLLGIDGIDAPEKIREYNGWTVEIPESERREIEEDEYYLYELEGLDVVDPNGIPIGSVVEAFEGGGGILLTIRRDSGAKFDVPLVKEICTRIDLDQGCLVADLPRGIEAIEEAPMADRREERRLAGTLHEPLPSEPKQTLEPRERPELRIDVVTIFPPMFDAIRNEGIIARAVKQKILDLNVWDLRDYATDRHRSTDDEAYGGGAGMVMLAEPFFRCIEQINSQRPDQKPRVLLLSPQGRTFRNEIAKELATEPWLVLLCGRYEGVDQRVHEALVDDELSIGDYVLSGGELAAMVVIDALGRMVNDVVGDRNSVEADSFYNGLLDHPHYTRPAEIRGMKVPDVLLSGHAERIRQWRKMESLRATLRKRPDLLQELDLDEESQQMLESLESELRSGR